MLLSIVASLSSIVASKFYAYLTIVLGVLFAWALSASLSKLYDDAERERKGEKRKGED